MWCQTNGMELKVQKCKVIKFHKTRTNTNFVYQINGNTLECVDQIRDLGVLFCSSPDLSSHIDTIISRALRMLGFIKRCTKQFVDINAIKTYNLLMFVHTLNMPHQYGAQTMFVTYIARRVSNANFVDI